MCLMLQSAPANENTKSDNNYVAAAASNLEITYSQMGAAAASNTDLPDSEDEFGSYAWRQPHPGIPRADAKSGKASFDGQGQMINPSQGPSATTTENTELEQSSTPDSPARVLPHHGNSLLQRVTNLIHCLGPRKMNMVKVRQNVMSTDCRVVHATSWSNSVLAPHQASSELLLLLCVALSVKVYATSTLVHMLCQPLYTMSFSLLHLHLLPYNTLSCDHSVMRCTPFRSYCGTC